VLWKCQASCEIASFSQPSAIQPFWAFGRTPASFNASNFLLEIHEIRYAYAENCHAGRLRCIVWSTVTLHANGQAICNQKLWLLLPISITSTLVA
jgi:hypothetical protein